MTMARVVEKGGRQSVQLPEGLRFRGREVEVIQRGDEIKSSCGRCGRILPKPSDC